MVIQIVDIHGVPVLEPKRYPPVARNGYRMVPPLATLEEMQTKAGDIHAFRTSTSIEGCEDPQEFRDVPLGNSRRPALLIELPQAAMPECPDHQQNVWCLSTIVNHKERSADHGWSRREAWGRPSIWAWVPGDEDSPRRYMRTAALRAVNRPPPVLGGGRLSDKSVSGGGPSRGTP